jgi:hypothetical protein
MGGYQHAYYAKIMKFCKLKEGRIASLSGYNDESSNSIKEGNFLTS